MKARSPYRAIKDQLQDDAASLIAWLQTPLQRLLVCGFRRPILWWLFRAHGTSLAFSPAGLRKSRYRLWLDPSSYSDFILSIYEPTSTDVLRQYVKEASLCVEEAEEDLNRSARYTRAGRSSAGH
jgi:hypothetical protein